MSETRQEAGAALMTRLFGRPAPANAVPERMRRYTVEHLFGDVWQDPAMSTEEHSMVTCAVLVALGREEQQRAHFRGARNLGVPRDKLEAMIGHVMHYAGWPAGMTAIRVLGEVWDAMDAEERG